MRDWVKFIIIGCFALLLAQSVVSVTMRFSNGSPGVLSTLSSLPLSRALRDHEACGANVFPNLEWFAPPITELNDINRVFRMHGPPADFIFDSSDGDPNTYNFCNMPRVNPVTYPRKPEGYHLDYIEVVTRHHKRTPYAANLIPGETAEWICDDEQLFYSGEPTGENMEASSHTYWQTYTTNANPLSIGYNATCQFPQITAAGLMDSYNHGADARGVYLGMLNAVPKEFSTRANVYRVTTNPITSQVASRFILGMWPDIGEREENVPLLVQPGAVDSLEPSYSCPAAETLFASYGPGSKSENWTEHLRRSADLKKRLDSITGINPNNLDWNKSWDHYYDNFAARLCHQQPLPCKAEGGKNDCVEISQANDVFRLGQYEYSFIYRDSEESFRASVASYGIYMGELVQNLRSFMPNEVSATEYATTSRVKMRHNFAHDGSLARILSILQINQMVWPGMGAELVFELYRRESPFEKGMKCYYLRVLWGGQIMRSSHPDFGRMDMIPVGTFLAYIDGLVGVRGSKIPAMCAGEL